MMPDCPFAAPTATCKFAMAELIRGCDQVERAEWCEKCPGEGRRKLKISYAYYLTRLLW